MKETAYPTYELRSKEFKHRSRTYRFLSFDPPFEWLSDLSHIHFSYFETLIKELEEVVAGQRTETGAFGGERLTCTAFKDRTLCEDMIDDTYLWVETAWMLRVIRDFYAFKKPFFGGYAPEEPGTGG